MIPTWVASQYGFRATPMEKLLEALQGTGSYFWDFTDETKVFTDAAGTTPVSAAGDDAACVKDLMQDTVLSQVTGTKAPKWQASAGADFDGVDDFLVSDDTIDFTNTKQMMTIIGVRKRDDSTRGMIVEQSAVASNPGKFFISGPDFAAQESFGINLMGASTNTYYQVAPFPSPVNAVISTAFDLTGANRAANVKVWMDGVANTTGGGGSNTGVGDTTFGNYLLYLGMRGGTTLPADVMVTGLLLVPTIDANIRVLAEEAFAVLNEGLPT